MLAETLLSAEDLGLSDVEHRSLITVLHMMELGVLVHVQANKYDMLTGKLKVTVDNGFNMGPYIYHDQENCGTAACIAGWANIVSGKVAFNIADVQDMIYDTKRNNKELMRLFVADFKDRSVEESATALRAFLQTGKTVWK